MSFGSNGVDHVRSLRKISTQLRLANLCVNGASSASFVSTFSCRNKTVRNAPKHEFWVQWSGSGAFVEKKSDATFLANLCVNGISSASFASTFVQ
jgi:hypothetical protein